MCQIEASRSAQVETVQEGANEATKLDDMTRLAA